MKTAIRCFRYVLSVAVLLAVVLSTGCAYLGLPPASDFASQDRTSETTGSGVTAADDIRVAPTQPKLSLLAAARANNINMFGEITSSDYMPFSPKTAIALRQHTFVEEGGDFDVDINRSGTAMVFSSTRHSTHPDLYMKAIDGVAVTQLTSDPSSDVQPSVSPDGQRVAFASDRSGNWDIWMMDLNGSQPVQVTNSPADEIHPSWSPDGKQLVFCSLLGGHGQWELWIADANAGAARRFIGYGLFPQWSPTADEIVYQRARERGSRWFSVWKIELTNGEPGYPVELAYSARHAMILPCWNNDGKKVAYTAVTPGTPVLAGEPAPVGASDVWVMNENGSRRVRLTDGTSGNFSPAFSPDGRIYFSTSRSGSENIWSLLPDRRNAASGSPSQMTRENAQDTANMASTIIDEPMRGTDAQ